MGGHQFFICDLAIRLDLRRMSKIKCIVACRHAQANALGKAPEVVGKAFDPKGLVRATRKGAVFVHVASGGVDDRFFLLSGK